jgi:hypothetical protein
VRDAFHCLFDIVFRYGDIEPFGFLHLKLLVDQAAQNLGQQPLLGLGRGRQARG